MKQIIGLSTREKNKTESQNNDNRDNNVKKYSLSLMLPFKYQQKYLIWIPNFFNRQQIKNQIILFVWQRGEKQTNKNQVISQPCH